MTEALALCLLGTCHQLDCRISSRYLWSCHVVAVQLSLAAACQHSTKAKRRSILHSFLLLEAGLGILISEDFHRASPLDYSGFLHVRAGQVGFGRDMGATRSLLDDDEPGQAITATQAAQAECEAGLNDPLRNYKLWRPVRNNYPIHNRLL
jgi:hypothetical protein